MNSNNNIQSDLINSFRRNKETVQERHFVLQFDKAMTEFRKLKEHYIEWRETVCDGKGFVLIVTGFLDTGKQFCAKLLLES